MPNPADAVAVEKFLSANMIVRRNRKAKSPAFPPGSVLVANLFSSRLTFVEEQKSLTQAHLWRTDSDMPSIEIMFDTNALRGVSGPRFATIKFDTACTSAARPHDHPLSTLDF